MKEIQEKLFALQEPEYGDFIARINPAVPRQTILGVRTPLLRAMAKELKKTALAEAFLAELPHAYFEENQLHAFLLESVREFDACMEQVERFLPFVDNWATCDQLRPKVFGRHLPELWEKVKVWLHSDRVYTVRFGMEMLMNFGLDDTFSPEFPAWVAEAEGEDYYIRMMAAWYFATALAKQWDETLPYLTENRLPEWTHNKTIQKAIESSRITPEQKAYLRTLRRDCTL